MAEELWRMSLKMMLFIVIDGKRGLVATSVMGVCITNIECDLTCQTYNM